MVYSLPRSELLSFQLVGRRSNHHTSALSTEVLSDRPRMLTRRQIRRAREPAADYANGSRLRLKVEPHFQLELALGRRPVSRRCSLERDVSERVCVIEVHLRAAI